MDTGRTNPDATPTRRAGDLVLRRAVAADAPAIRALVRAAYQHYVARIGREPMPMTADYDRAIAEHEIWLLDDANGIGAVLELKPCGGGELSIENIAVDAARQKSGIGRKLMAFAEEEARRQGRDRVTLYTNEKMVENIALYTRLGYVETERRDVGEFRRIFMGKDLR
jgi:ribosomal protein S18 acetylase RimI-like enzyme